MYDARIILAPPYVISLTDAHAACAHQLQLRKQALRLMPPFRDFDSSARISRHQEFSSPNSFHQLPSARLRLLPPGVQTAFRQAQASTGRNHRSTPLEGVMAKG